MIEASTSRARHMCDHAVKYLAAFFIGVKILVDKVPQKAPALRNSYGVSALYRRGRMRIVFQVRKKIANRCQPHAHHCWILAAIDHFVYFAWDKSSIEMDEMRIGCQLASDHVSKAPIVTRNLCACFGRRIAHCQNIGRAFRIIHGLTVSSARSQEYVTERPVSALLRRSEVRAHQSMNFFAACIMSNRRSEPQALTLA